MGEAAALIGSMNTFFTSDVHFGHKHVARTRGYTTPAEHDAALAQTWREQVGRGDDVFVLGDLTVGRQQAVLEWLDELPGTKHLILGNHDDGHPLMRSYRSRFARLTQTFATVGTVGVIRPSVGKVFLSHFPYEGDHGPDRYVEHRLRDQGVPLLHGHTHGPERATLTSKGTVQVHVGLDAWGGRLVDQREIEVLLAG